MSYAFVIRGESQISPLSMVSPPRHRWEQSNRSLQGALASLFASGLRYQPKHLRCTHPLRNQFNRCRSFKELNKLIKRFRLAIKYLYLNEFLRKRDVWVQSQGEESLQPHARNINSLPYLNTRTSMITSSLSSHWRTHSKSCSSIQITQVICFYLPIAIRDSCNEGS